MRYIMASPCRPADVTIIVLLTNPLNKGTPEIESPPTKKSQKVIGMVLYNPPNSVSFSFPVTWMTAPGPMKSNALYRIWQKA
ncbi:MAG: hypothetical protein DDT26_02482 [Dehalococcoidia bacterium]|nr:hypothetical protein [Chloroflexota bacterium]